MATVACTPARGATRLHKGSETESWRLRPNQATPLARSDPKPCNFQGGCDALLSVAGTAIDPR